MSSEGTAQSNSDGTPVAGGWVEFSEAGLLSFFKRADPITCELTHISSDGFAFVSTVEIAEGKTITVTLGVGFFDDTVTCSARILSCARSSRSAFLVRAKFTGERQDVRPWVKKVEIAVQNVTVSVQCPHCMRYLRMRFWMIGRSTKCPSCKEVIELLEEVKSDPSDSALQSAENVLEALDVMQGAAEVGTVKGSVLHARIQHFLMKYIETPVHLAIIEYIHGREGQQLNVAKTAKELNVLERRVRAACEDLVALDILKRVIQNYLFDPDMVAQRDVNDFMRDYSDAETKSKVLAYVMATERDADF